MVIGLAVVFVMSGCAQKASKIDAAYVSPLKYNNKSCRQIKNEVIRVNEKLVRISAKQDKASTNDAVAMGVGLVLFWPALFLLATTDDEKEEISRLKGEYTALKEAAAHKRCRFVSEMR